MLRFSTAGESHGESLVAVLSGMPAGVTVDQEFLNRELWRRQRGYGRGGRMRIETDTAHILSGVRHGKTIGSPIAMVIANADWKNWTEILPVEEGDAAKRQLYASSHPPLQPEESPSSSSNRCSPAPWQSASQSSSHAARRSKYAPYRARSASVRRGHTPAAAATTRDR